MAIAIAKAPALETGAPRRRRVLHVSSAHRVSDGRISWKEADALADAGYAVTVLALRRATGATLPKGPRFVEYAAPGSRLRRFLLRLPWLLAYCTRHRYDVYHLHDPELILVGFLLKLMGRRVIYDVHESYPMVLLDRDWISPYLRPFLSRRWRALEAAFVRTADLTVAAHEIIQDGYAGGNVTAVRNFPISEHLAPIAPPTMSRRPCRVLYHGDITEQRGLFTMVQAMAEVDERLSAVLRLGGSLRPALHEKLKAAEGAARTVYLGWLDRSQLLDELSNARAGLVLLHPTNNYLVIRPNKLYEYMAAGLPIIASDFDHWREIVVPARCGMLVDPLDPSAIARAIEYIFTHPEEAAAMGERGRRAVAERYNWQSERQKLVTEYDRLFGFR